MIQKYKITQIDLTLFFRQFATLINAGVPLSQSFDLLAKSQTNLSLRQLIYQLKQNTNAGKSFSQSLAEVNYFTPLVCQWLSIAEQSGQLDVMLNKIAAFYEKNTLLKKRIHQMLFYPACIIASAILMTLAMLIFVIPHFAELFHDSQVELPLLTRLIFQFANFLPQLLFIIGLIPSILFCIHKCRPRHKQRTLICHPEHKRRIPQCLTNITSLQKLITQFELTHFAYNLNLSLSAGVPLYEALTLIGESSRNEFARIIQETQRKIAAGSSLHRALNQTRYFPPLMIQMVKTGEESGMLEEMLLKAAIFLEADFETLTTRLQQLLEPLIMLLLGVLIGGLVIGMYLPIFKLGSAL